MNDAIFSHSWSYVNRECDGKDINRQVSHAGALQFHSARLYTQSHPQTPYTDSHASLYCTTLPGGGEVIGLIVHKCQLLLIGDFSLYLKAQTSTAIVYTQLVRVSP